MNQRLRIDLLGRVTLSFGNRTTSTFTTSRVRDLLVTLVLRRGELWERAFLIRQIWPDSGGMNDRNRLSVALYHLRQLLSSLECDPDEILHANRSCVWIEADKVETDLWEFEDAFQAGLKADEDSLRRERYQEAVRLYRGVLNSGSDLAWIDHWRAVLADFYGRMVTWLAKDLHDQGKDTEARLLINQALDRSEGAVELLKVVVRQADHVNDGAQVIDGLRSVVRFYRQRGVEPDEETRAFVKEMRSKYSPGSDRSVRQSARPMTAVYAGEKLLKTLQRISQSHGASLDENRPYVLARNPLVAADIAHELLQESRGARVVLHTLITPPELPLPENVEELYRTIPTGSVYATGATSALIQDHQPQLVRETVAAKNGYRIVRD